MDLIVTLLARRFIAHRQRDLLLVLIMRAFPCHALARGRGRSAWRTSWRTTSSGEHGFLVTRNSSTICVRAPGDEDVLETDPRVFPFGHDGAFENDRHTGLGGQIVCDPARDPFYTGVAKGGEQSVSASESASATRRKSHLATEARSALQRLQRRTLCCIDIRNSKEKVSKMPAQGSLNRQSQHTLQPRSSAHFATVPERKMQQFATVFKRRAASLHQSHPTLLPLPNPHSPLLSKSQQSRTTHVPTTSQTVGPITPSVKNALISSTLKRLNPRIVNHLNRIRILVKNPVAARRRSSFVGRYR